MALGGGGGAAAVGRAVRGLRRTARHARRHALAAGGDSSPPAPPSCSPTGARGRFGRLPPRATPALSTKPFGAIKGERGEERTCRRLR